MTEITESSSKDQLAAVRAYASDAMGRPSEAVTAVTPFEDGNRHAVHRVSFRDASEGMDSRSRLAHIIERVNWWEPVTLLGSALWWVERWVRRTELDTEGKADPGVSREPGYYFGHVISRIDRLDTLVSAGSA
jgi:hypothetical protein